MWQCVRALYNRPHFLGGHNLVCGVSSRFVCCIDSTRGAGRFADTLLTGVREGPDSSCRRQEHMQIVSPGGLYGSWGAG